MPYAVRIHERCPNCGEDLAKWDPPEDEPAAPAEGLDVAERRRLAGALANWALSPGESFRTLLPYLDLDYETAYREGWMAFTNAINERLTQAEVAPAEGLDYLWTRMRDLLNSLGIAGPNIYHRVVTPDDSLESLGWEHLPDNDDDWCVCGRIWPCEARQLALLVDLAAEGQPAAPAEGLREALEVISEGRHPNGHRGAVLVARAALDHHVT